MPMFFVMLVFMLFNIGMIGAQIKHCAFFAEITLFPPLKFL